MKKTRLLEIIQEEIDTAINEIPDFGGKFDSQVADKHGEEDTLQSATDEIVDETLKDMGVTKADLKKDADKLSTLECLNVSDDNYAKVCNQWSEGIFKVFDSFPRFDWEK